MGVIIGVDVGGTFTDCFLSNGKQVAVAKVPTTYYDPSVGFIRALEQGSDEMDADLPELLARVESIRYSTTIGTNALIERSGPKLGLITTSGFEDAIYIGRARQWADGIGLSEFKDLARIQKPQPLIPRNMVVGIRERVDSNGQVVMPLDRSDVLEKLQYLVDQGATGFAICLLWSFRNPSHEKLIRQIIREEYPEAYLGNMPVLLSSSVSPKAGEYGRFMTTIVNAYMHRDLSDQLSRLEEELRDRGYRRPLILVHNSGGTRKVSRTRAVNTHNAGPVAGLLGSLHVGRLYGVQNIIYTDMGGTSFDMGVVAGGKIPSDNFVPVIDRWRTQISAVETRSIGAGGGSIAWINRSLGNELEVGPQSARSMPGPACYNLGGVEPTVTDADLVLGYLNPEYYVGGQMRLHKEKAETAIWNRIAQPLGISVVEAAWRIKQVIDAKMGQEIYKEVALKGHDPREFALFATGGAGPAHCCGFNAYLEAQRIITCPYSPVFGAFGATTLETMHIYEHSRYLKVLTFGSQQYLSDYESFNGVVAELKRQALKDFELEGFSPDKIHFTLELEMKYGTQFTVTRTVSPLLELHSEDDVRRLVQAFEATYAGLYGTEAAFPVGGVDIETFMLRATVPQAGFDFPRLEAGGAEPPARALKGQRDIFWGTYGDFRPTAVYDFRQMLAGNRIEGPAVLEAPETTYVVEPGYRFTLDEYGNALFERLAGRSSSMKEAI